MPGWGGRPRREYFENKYQKGEPRQILNCWFGVNKFFSGSDGTAAALGFFDSVTSRIVIPSGARNMLCPAPSKNEIPRCARNDKCWKFSDYFGSDLLWFSKLVGSRNWLMLEIGSPIWPSKPPCLELGPFLIASSVACLLPFPRL
jgi:hypothetical protein